MKGNHKWKFTTGSKIENRYRLLKRNKNLRNAWGAETIDCLTKAEKSKSTNEHGWQSNDVFMFASGEVN